MRKARRSCSLALALTFGLVSTACDLRELFGDDDDDEALVVNVTHYVGEDGIQLLGVLPGEAKEFTTACDRLIEFSVNNGLGATKIELVRTFGGVETVCEILDADGAVRSTFHDWPASSTIYNIRVEMPDGTVEFGPFDVTVEAKDEVVVGYDVNMGTQAPDGTCPHCFFTSRGWGGGWVVPNYASFQAQYMPRLIDFATVMESGQLKAISPDQIQQTETTFQELAHDCGYTTTTFAAYTGSLDPETADLTLAEVNALPDPPATTTSINLSSDFMFVYLTGEGKKGLVKVKNVVESNGAAGFGLTYSVGR
ncbi:MAG: hypothetical protein ABIJ09_03010 [Pseudomonadota bacterium]